MLSSCKAMLWVDKHRPKTLDEASGPRALSKFKGAFKGLEFRALGFRVQGFRVLGSWRNSPFLSNQTLDYKTVL